ncbi:hypothetical protein HK105_200949 [Polyrhizophydium stewartii]|uniref:tRNA-splicing endonuclease subunit Sen15 domain-containing protein n=1 Tax=Polyrhizophydium stewartii TaxID=2732419 RepID=A0ABR4NIL5_9FUNG
MRSLAKLVADDLRLARYERDVAVQELPTGESFVVQLSGEGGRETATVVVPVPIASVWTPDSMRDRIERMRCHAGIAAGPAVVALVAADSSVVYYRLDFSEPCP